MEEVVYGAQDCIAKLPNARSASGRHNIERLCHGWSRGVETLLTMRMKNT